MERGWGYQYVMWIGIVHYITSSFLSDCLLGYNVLGCNFSSVVYIFILLSSAPIFTFENLASKLNISLSVVYVLITIKIV